MHTLFNKRISAFSEKTKVLLLLVLILSAGLSSCYSNAMQYDLGWTTTKIQGVMKEKTQPLNSKGFLVIQEYYALFVQMQGAQSTSAQDASMQNAPVYVPHARLVFPDSNGNFEFNFNLKATKIEVHWIASDYVMQRLFFQRQVGVGDLTYDAIMERTDSWKEHLVLHIIPFLQNFIVESNYQMPNNDQLFLGEWIAQEQVRMNSQE